MAATNPLREFPKRSEKVKKFAKNKTVINSSNAPFLSGSAKSRMSMKIDHRTIVKINAGKKFFLFLISRSRVFLNSLSLSDTIDIWMLY